MKTRSPLWTVAIALSGLLVITVGLMALGEHESETNPAAASNSPSGVSALQELFRRSGYKVAVDYRTKPQLQKGDIAVAFYKDGYDYGGGFNTETQEKVADQTQQALSDFVRDGGSLISLPVGSDFRSASRQMLSTVIKVQSIDGRKANVNWNGNGATQLLAWETPKAEYPLWSTPNTPFVTVRRIGAGTDVVVAEGMMATNRFIDREENAAVLMDAVRVVAKPGSRVVFTEAAWGNADDPSLMELIGPWAKAAWMQILFLGLVIVYTLGKPFGLPNPERRKQRGSRELLDAIGHSLHRGRMTQFALRSLHDDTNRYLRKWFRGPRNTDPLNPEAQAMSSLHQALGRVEAAIEIGAPEHEAAALAKDVERLLREVAQAGAHGYRPGS